MFSWLSRKIKIKTLFNIAEKEFVQLSRDPRSIFIIIFIPIFLLVVFGYGVTMDIKNINLVVCDQSKTSLSDEFIREFISSGFFKLVGYVDDLRKIDGFLVSGRAKVGIVISHDFANEIAMGRPVKVQIIIDGSDANTANVVLGYVQQIVQGFSRGEIENYIFKITGRNIQAIDLKPRIWFNQELKSVNFFIPGLMGLIMMVMTVLMTSLSISRERELGSFERLISTPLSPSFIIAGKLIPYAVLAFIDSVLILLAGYILFNLKVKGDLFSLLFVTVIFIFCGLNIGLIISTVARSQQSTMAIAFISTVVPTFILSGFVFPIRNMPWVLQLLSYLVPARYYLDVILGIILKGNGLFEHVKYVFVLLFFIFSTFVVASLRLRKLMREI
jgi:ABC-2 type transport system permease protein